MKSRAHLVRSNVDLAQATWGEVPAATLSGLAELTERYRLSVALGDLQYLDGRWYVTHAGLLRISSRNRCAGIEVRQVRGTCDPATGRWVFKATVYKSTKSRGFVGYGDADPSNVSPLVHGAEMRVAETRAVNRALRKAYGIGLCSVEELGWVFGPSDSTREDRGRPASTKHSVSDNGQPRLRDRLCLLIRQYQLDPSLVKRYAADFCGTEFLRGASRELVESFINHVAEWAARDREGLLCKLNGYSQTEEANS